MNHQVFKMKREKQKPILLEQIEALQLKVEQYETQYEEIREDSSKKEESDRLFYKLQDTQTKLDEVDKRWRRGYKRKKPAL
jgi:hypothetical protein